MDYNASKIIVLVVILTVIAIPSADAGSLSQVKTGSQNSRILRCGLHVTDLSNLDPHRAAASQDRTVADMIFNGLLRYLPGDAPNIEPDLAETMPEFEIIDGKQIWTVKLRQGVMFHPGPDTPAYELTADDVVYSLKKSADPKYSSYAGDYTQMIPVKIDRYTINITLNKPLSPVMFFSKIADYSGGFIVSRKAIEEKGYENFLAHPIGTGPFMFSEYLPGEKLTLEANRQYFRGTARLEKIELLFIPKIENRVAALRQGTLDIITGSGKKGWYEKMEELSGITLDSFGVGETAVFYINKNIQPFDDIRVRKAVAYALDRAVFLETASKHLVQEAFSPIPAKYLAGGLSAAMAGKLGLDYQKNITRARNMLVEASLPDGFSIELVTSEKRLYRTLYKSLQQQLAIIGIDCKIRTIAHGEMHKVIRKQQLPIVLYAAWRPNADVYLTRFFHSDSIIVTGASPDTNFSGYDNIDKLIEDARLEINPTKQVQLWEQAQIRILSDMVAYPVLTTLQLFARKTSVDYGHDLKNSMALYPQFTEKTHKQPQTEDLATLTAPAQREKGLKWTGRQDEYIR